MYNYIYAGGDIAIVRVSPFLPLFPCTYKKKVES